MARKRVEGICRGCGDEAKLTFEHIPPESAYNSDPAKVYVGLEWLKLEKGRKARYQQQQAGSGYFALCQKCNNERGGDWYVPEYLRLVRAAAGFINDNPMVNRVHHCTGLQNSVARARFDLLKDVKPSLIAKQIILMMLAINSAEFGDANPALRDYIYDREAIGLPDEFRLYLGLHTAKVAHYVGGMCLLVKDERGDVGAGGVISEILHPPFVYTLTINQWLPACDITPFTKREADDTWCGEMAMPINWSVFPVALNGYSFLPLA
jgi:hypothetical protein